MTNVTEITAAFLSNANVPASAVPGLINEIASALRNLSGDGATSTPTPAGPTRAQIRRSIKPSGLISFEDGKPYKSLKRHLSARGLTPDSYRQKWGLPDDYPMVSPEYSAARSALAIRIGLGAGGGKASKAKAAAPKSGREPSTDRPKPKGSRR